MPKETSVMVAVLAVVIFIGQMLAAWSEKKLIKEKMIEVGA